MNGQRAARDIAPKRIGESRDAFDERLHAIEAQLAERMKQRRRRRRRDINTEFRGSFSRLDRIALFITTRVGTFGFFLIVFSWTLCWLGWNTLAPRTLRFDPAPAFVLWLFISNMIQISLMPLIMVGQNLLGRHAELRAESDFEINQKAEDEIETILLGLERQAVLIERQDAQILKILDVLRAASPAPVVQSLRDASVNNV